MTFNDKFFLELLSKKYPVADKLCGGVCSINGVFADTVDCSDGYYHDRLTFEDCILLTSYFGELASYLRLKSIYGGSNNEK